MHICVSKPTIIGSDNCLSPDQRQAIIRTNAGIWLMGPLGTNFSEILIEIHTFSFKKMHLKMSSAKWRLFCLCLNVLMPKNPWAIWFDWLHEKIYWVWKYWMLLILPWWFLDLMMLVMLSKDDKRRPWTVKGDMRCRMCIRAACCHPY